MGSFTLQSRTQMKVIAIAGMPGAGKSTLIKILSGAYTCDAGEIFISGRKVHITSPRADAPHCV